MNTRLCY